MKERSNRVQAQIAGGRKRKYGDNRVGNAVQICELSATCTANPFDLATSATHWLDFQTSP